MEAQLAELRRTLKERLASVKSTRELEEQKLYFLGKKGRIAALMPLLRDAKPEAKPELGKLINDLKVEAEGHFALLADQLLEREEVERLGLESLDITLPGRRPRLGRKHPLTQMMDEMLEAHIEMGFSVQYSSEIESDYYNFEALNIFEDHPARDMQDTFYIEPEILLRTHTSATQVRVMERHPPPIRIASPGRCYRNEDVTPRAHVFFHQVEGLYVDEEVTFADLLETLRVLLTRFFQQEVETRFRPSYFPFVEPGLEVDIGCMRCSGSGCPLCKQTGWLEVLGAGMVHPEVLSNVGIDPERYSGYAWGIGIDRLVLMRYGIDDIRTLSENDMRFLCQFSPV